MKNLVLAVLVFGSILLSSMSIRADVAPIVIEPLPLPAITFPPPLPPAVANLPPGVVRPGPNGMVIDFPLEVIVNHPEGVHVDVYVDGVLYGDTNLPQGGPYVIPVTVPDLGPGVVPDIEVDFGNWEDFDGQDYPDFDNDLPNV